MYLGGSAQSADAESEVKSSRADSAYVHLAQDPTNGVVPQISSYADDPVIARLRMALAKLQSNELHRLFGRLPDLDDHSRDAIRQFADCMVANMIHPPVECLRDIDSGESGAHLLNALERLFLLSE
jgi:glutamyl-tRNA reductase